ncbi:MAG: hypothetical protein RLZZ546_2971, partial [Bacteroidota bacterium]
MRSLLIIGLIILSLTFAKIFIFNKEEENKNTNQSKPNQGNSMKKSPPPMLIDIYIAKQQDLNNEIYASGTLVANEEVELRSETSGRLTQLLIKEGGYVTQGQLLAKLNDAEILAKIKKIKFEQDLANQIEIRQKKLLDINAISREEYEIATNKVSTLEADKEALLAALAQTEIRAPFSGKIGLKNISKGAYLTPGTSIANLVQTHPMKIDFSVPEKYGSMLSPGKKIKFQTEEKNQAFEATIIATDSKIDETLRTIKIRASIPNLKGQLVPGSFVKVSASLGKNKSIMIPSEAIIPFVGGKKIFKLKNGMATESTITSGLRTETSVEV